MGKLMPELNEAQADGLACVICHNETNPMQPVGTHLGVQLFMCISHDNPPIADVK